MTVQEIAEAIIALQENKKTAEKNAKEKKIKEKGLKYPFQVTSIKRTKKVLGVDAKLFAPTEREKLSPLELHSGYSRFELTIVDKENNTTPTANIPAEDIPYIYQTSKIALEHLLIGNASETGGGQVVRSPAYTQKLMSNQFKGLTPAEVLIKDKNAETGLLNAKIWLESNLSKYPGNKGQIDAINDAINLLHNGKLSSDNVNTSVSNIEVYKTDYKFKSKQNEKGYNLIYGIEVICDPSKKYPFQISIMNCYAPVETSPNGQKNIKMNSAENTVKSSMLVTKEEWFKLISKLNRTVSYFEQMNFAELFNESKIAGEYNGNNSSNK